MVWRRAVVGRVVAATAVVVDLSQAMPAAAVPVLLTDVTQDVGDRRADISSMSLDQDGAALAVGVRMVEFADPRTDFYWRNPRASSLVEVRIDKDNDNKADYFVDFLRAQVGKTTVSALAVQVFSTTSIALRCTGTY